jgi:hypothetical protein
MQFCFKDKKEKIINVLQLCEFEKVLIAIITYCSLFLFPLTMNQEIVKFISHLFFWGGGGGVEGEKFNLSLLTQKGFYRGKTWKL